MTLSKSDQDKINTMQVDIMYIKKLNKIQTWLIGALLPLVIPASIWMGVKNIQIDKMDDRITSIESTTASVPKKENLPVIPMIEAMMPKNLNYSKPKK